MAIQFPTINIGQRKKSNTELQAEALKRRQAGQNTLSGIGSFFSNIKSRTPTIQQPQQTQSTFKPQIGGFNVPTLNVFGGNQDQLVSPTTPKETEPTTPLSNEQIVSLLKNDSLFKKPESQKPVTSAEETTIPATPTLTNDDLRAQIAALEASIRTDASFENRFRQTLGNETELQKLANENPEEFDTIANRFGFTTSPIKAPQLPQAPPQEDRLAAIEKALLEAQTKTPEEEQAEKTLANLIASKELGLRGIEEQPIPLDFITGQSAALERRAATQAIPLQTQLAQYQAKRQAALDVAKTKFEFEKVRRGEQKGEIKEVDGNLVRVKSDGTVETIFKAPEKTEKPVTVSPGGALVDPTTGQVIYQAPKQPTEAETLKALERAEKNEEAKNTQTQTIGIVNSILGNSQLGTISGISAKGGIGLLTGATRQATAGIRGQLSQLKALTALEGRNKLKGTGAISDFEAGMLANSANALNFSIQDDGRVLMSDNDVKRNLQNIKGSLLLKAGQSVPAIVTNPETGESVQSELTSKEAQDLWLDGNLIDFQ